MNYMYRRTVCKTPRWDLVVWRVGCRRRNDGDTVQLLEDVVDCFECFFMA